MLENVRFDCSERCCENCNLCNGCAFSGDMEEVADAFPVGYLGGDYNDMEQFGPDG